VTATVQARSWANVERSSSLFLLSVLLCVLGMRLGFAWAWPMPTVDFWLSLAALVLVVGALLAGRDRRAVRLTVIALAGATQLLPMVLREPVLLLPLLGALIPVAILVICLVALARKDRDHPAGS
jgi:peptidoglycan/LPS O-acetylase OafA/YrhL